MRFSKRMGGYTHRVSRSEPSILTAGMETETELLNGVGLGEPTRFLEVSNEIFSFLGYIDWVGSWMTK